jgi:hypothetical protein
LRSDVHARTREAALDRARFVHGLWVCLARGAAGGDAEDGMSEAGPVWVLNGRRYSTVRGLTRALVARHSRPGLVVVGVSMVRPDRSLSVYGGDECREIARYLVDAPKLGEAMHVKLIG